MLDITAVPQSGKHCDKTDTPATQIVLISFGFRNTSYNILPPWENCPSNFIVNQI